MGFLNIGGNQVHTSAISNVTWTSGSSGTYSSSTISNTNGLVFSSGTGTYTTIQAIKTTYHVLGEDVEVSGYKDGMVAIMVAQLNVLGKPFYDELKKQDCYFPTQIDEFIKRKFEIEETAKQFIK